MNITYSNISGEGCNNVFKNKYKKNTLRLKNNTIAFYVLPLYNSAFYTKLVVVLNIQSYKLQQVDIESQPHL